MITRRSLLLAMGASACAARLPATPRASALTGLVRLGWRWVPGVTLRYRTVVTRELGSVQVRRAEEWAYTAQSLDASGVVRLSGQLMGFGASVQVNGEDLPERRVVGAREAEQAGIADQVTLDLRLTGRVVECSLSEFAAALPHRVLAIHFPPEPMGSGASWPDGGLLRAFEGAIPMEAEVRTEATTALGNVDPSGDGWQAHLTHTARMQVGDGGPALEIAGTSVWDTQPGALASRHLEARWRPDAPPGGRGAVGVLRIDLVRLDNPPPRDG